MSAFPDRLTEAVRYVAHRGFISPREVGDWAVRLSQAAGQRENPAVMRRGARSGLSHTTGQTPRRHVRGLEPVARPFVQ